MESSEKLSAFRGSSLRLLLKLFLYLAAGGIVLSVIFMGGHWARLFIVAAIMAAPLVLAVAVFAVFSDRFFFDDEKGAILRPFHRPIPYGSVRSVSIRKSGALLQVSARHGSHGRTTLALAIAAKEEERLTAELGKRFPQTIIQRKRLSGHAIFAAVLTIIILAGAAGHVYLYRKYPQLGVTPQLPAWEKIQSFPKKTPRHYLYSFSFALPKDFSLIIDKESELVYQDKKTNTRIKVAYDLRAAKGGRWEPIVRRALGVENDYDVLDLSWSARIGIVPLLLKTITLEDLSETAVYRIGQGQLQGFMIRARQGGEEVVDVLLMDGAKGEKIELLLSGPKKAPDKLVQKIVGSVEMAKRALPAQ